MRPARAPQFGVRRRVLALATTANFARHRPGACVVTFAFALNPLQHLANRAVALSKKIMTVIQRIPSAEANLAFLHYLFWCHLLTLVSSGTLRHKPGASPLKLAVGRIVVSPPVLLPLAMFAMTLLRKSVNAATVRARFAVWPALIPNFSCRCHCIARCPAKRLRVPKFFKCHINPFLF